MKRPFSWAIALLLTACEDKNGATADVSAADAAAAVALVSAATSPSEAGPAAPASGFAAVTAPCRLIAIVGSASTLDGGALHAMEAAPSDFLTIAAASQLSTRDTRTTREVTLKGPAKARVCVGGEQEVWLAEGEVSAAPGGGETPGAEVWVVTRFGVLRYPTGHVHVTATPLKTAVRAAEGAAFFPAPKWKRGADAGALDDEGWVTVKSTTDLEFTSEDTPATLADACAAQADVASKLAHAIVAGDGGPRTDLGDLASKHVRERRRAHAICAMAELAGNVVAPRNAAALEKAEKGEALWREIPLRSP